MLHVYFLGDYFVVIVCLSSKGVSKGTSELVLLLMGKLSSSENIILVFHMLSLSVSGFTVLLNYRICHLINVSGMFPCFILLLLSLLNLQLILQFGDWVLCQSDIFAHRIRNFIHLIVCFLVHSCAWLNGRIFIQVAVFHIIRLLTDHELFAAVVYLLLLFVPHIC